MSRKHFGTDGIRGVANQQLTPELAMSLGRAAGFWLRQSGGVPRIVVGRDTRVSGPMLGMALSAGFNSAGVDVVSLGVAPTPAVSFVARTGEFGLGVIISASHNPFPDNGIKLVDDRAVPLMMGSSKLDCSSTASATSPGQLTILMVWRGG